MQLSSVIDIQRRYSRSVNLERDMLRADSVLGYVLTRKGEEILDRVAAAARDKRSVSAYTLTGVYGTGKSAFAHFFSALTSPKADLIYQYAENLLLKRLKKSSEIYKFFAKELPEQGIIKAVVTARREPISQAVLRGLLHGIENYISTCPSETKNLKSLKKQIAEALGRFESNPAEVDIAHILDLIRTLSNEGAGLLIIVDEMGKTLEYAASDPDHHINAARTSDLYFLQQIAELTTSGHNKIFFFGLLHQSFDEYAGNMTPTHRNEWAKVQGRFEDIPFYESPEETFAVMSSALGHKANLTKKEYKTSLHHYNEIWQNALLANGAFQSNLANRANENLYASIYPLHPVSARMLPVLCQKFAQNDRSLFTFLAGQEPHSFGAFVNEYVLDESNPAYLPNLKISTLYDYFIESSGIGFRPGFQRWVEIQEKVEEARSLGHDHQNVIKTIGILNLLSSGGSLKAEKELTLLSLLDKPDQKKEKNKWNDIISELEQKGLIVYRKGLDEYRLWHGSDFNIEEAISEAKENQKAPLAKLLNENFYMRPLVAQRHSYETGTLRYFERIFIDASTNLEKLFNEPIQGDGLIVYYVDAQKEPAVAEKTCEGKPVLLLTPPNTTSLRSIAFEFDALKTVRKSNTKLLIDKVASKEIDQRIHLTAQLLNKTLEFSFQLNKDLKITYGAEIKANIFRNSVFNSCLSDLLDHTFSKSIILQNELINRRDLTSQGAAAQKKLMIAMVQNAGQERLGLEGYGPETSVFESTLIQTGIYQKNEKEVWHFTYPVTRGKFKANAGIDKAFKKLETVCFKAELKALPVHKLYAEISTVPFGVPSPVIPILFVAILLKNADSLSLYKDGTFIHTLGEAEIELLQKRPELFSIKSFHLSGLKGEYFKELETIFQTRSSTETIRNNSLLQVVKPFIKFVQALPAYTQKTSRLSIKSQKLMKVILNAREPDELLFRQIPAALGFLKENDLAENSSEKMLYSSGNIKNMKKELVQCLVELQNCYRDLLNNCSTLLYHNFSISSDPENLREELRVRAKRLLKGIHEPLLKRFVIAAMETESDDNNWLSALIMVVADKPPESFRDEDINLFELNISSIAKRFKNLESLMTHMSSKGEGFEGKKFTITESDGNELSEVIWIENSQRNTLEKIIEEFLANQLLSNNEKNKKAAMAILAEKIIAQTRNNEIQQVKEQKLKIKVNIDKKITEK